MNQTERLLNAAADHIAATLEQPSDMRAWEQLLIYCPRTGAGQMTPISPEYTREDLIVMIHQRDELVSDLKDRILDLEAALRSIANKCPATCDMTLAHEMAEEAEAALAPEQDK